MKISTACLAFLNAEFSILPHGDRFKVVAAVDHGSYAWSTTHPTMFAAECMICAIRLGSHKRTDASGFWVKVGVLRAGSLALI